jgi:hypothetical protein
LKSGALPLTNFHSPYSLKVENHWGETEMKLKRAAEKKAA